jgi:hypothetical protein
MLNGKAKILGKLTSWQKSKINYAVESWKQGLYLFLATKKKNHIQKLHPAKRRWLRPVILATQEAEIRGIAVRSQSGQIVHETLSWKKPITKKGWWSGSRRRPWVQASVLQKKLHPMCTPNIAFVTIIVIILYITICSKFMNDPSH